MPKANFTPLTEFDPAVCALPLPDYVNAERVGVDMRHIGRIAAWGGFKSDVRITFAEGETTSYSVGIAGQSGTAALAARTGIKQKAHIVDPQFAPDNDDDTRAVPQLTLQLNSAEITDRMQRKNQSLRDPKAWVRPIDHAVRKGLFDAAWRHMVGTVPTTTEAMIAAVSTPFCTILTIESWPNPANITVSTILWQFGVNVLADKQRSQGAAVREAHYSLLPIWHVDRALIATGALARRRVIKAL